MAVIDYSSPVYAGNKYLINGPGLFHAWIWKSVDRTGQMTPHWEFQGTFNLGQLANRIADVNADPWLFQHAGNDTTIDPRGAVTAGAAGADANEVAHLSSIVQSIGDRVDAAIARVNDGAYRDLWVDVFANIRAITDEAVTRIGPALDALTHDASKGATQHAWHVNQQIAELPIVWDPRWQDSLNEPSVRRAAQLAAQIQGIYSGALASL